MDELLRKLGINFNVAFYLIFFTLIWSRTLMMVSMVPFLFGRPVPRYVTVGAAMVLAIYVFPLIVPEKPPPISDDYLALVVLYVKEIFYGFAIGMAVSIIFQAYSAVGQMIDNQRGLSIARVLIPQLGEQGAVSGLFLFNLGIVIYLAAGGHLVFLNSFFTSFKTLPVLEFPVTGHGMLPLMDLFIKMTGEVIYISIQMATPVIIAIFLADLILGIANRVAPQINVWMLGFQIKGYLGTLLMFVSLTMVAEQMQHYSVASNRRADQVVQFLEGRDIPAPEPAVIPEDGMAKPQEGPQPVLTR
jgi:flagellar biosynthetic protein FliR